MSIWNSLYIGSSGLDAHGEAIGVVGDDIANVSTVGYKSTRAQFDDILGGTGDNGQRLGEGVRMGGTMTLFGQGTLQSTGRPLDLAIQGDGFFVLSGNHNGQAGTYYSRDGGFSLDKTGTLVDSSGLRVQGYLIGPSGAAASAATDLTIGGQSPPNPTSSITLGVNLDSSSQVLAAAWDPTNPSTTSNYSTSMTVNDSLGASHRVDVYFRTTASGAWDWHAMVDGGDLSGGIAGTPTEIASGALTFNTAGALDTATTNASSASFINANPNQAITFTFGDPIAAGGSGTDGSTQYAQPPTVKSVNQDGYAAGTLSDVSVGQDGTVTGNFSNGQSRPIARLALARFGSETGLQRAGDQLFTQTVSSGQALVGAAGTGSRGSIAGGSLESSNVDLGSELVTMIAYQRAFSANAKTVTTADEMLQTITSLKQ